MRYFSIKFVHIMPKFKNPENYNPDIDFSESGKFMWELDLKVHKAIEAAEIQIKHEYSFYDGSLYKYIRTNRFEMDIKRVIMKALTNIGLWHDFCTGYNQNKNLYCVIYELRMRIIKEDEDPIKANCKTIKELFDNTYGEENEQSS